MYNAFWSYPLPTTSVHLLLDSCPPLFLTITIIDNFLNPIMMTICTWIWAIPWDMDSPYNWPHPQRKHDSSLLSSHQLPIDLLLGFRPLELLPHAWHRWLFAQDLYIFYKFLRWMNATKWESEWDLDKILNETKYANEQYRVKSYLFILMSHQRNAGNPSAT